MAPWRRAAAALARTHDSAFPPLLYEYNPQRRAGEAPMLVPKNARVAALHYGTCRWGGCHPSRGESSIEWPAWRASAPWPATSSAGVGGD